MKDSTEEDKNGKQSEISREQNLKQKKEYQTKKKRII